MQKTEDEILALRGRIAELEAQLAQCAEVCPARPGTEDAAHQLRLHEWAIESSNEGIAIFDARQDDFPLVYVNAGFEKQTGYSREELLGRSARILHVSP